MSTWGAFEGMLRGAWALSRRLSTPACWLVLSCLLILGLVPAAFAEIHPVVPAFSSMPGAPYSVYLNFGGFNFSGDWGNDASYVPGDTPAYGTDGNASSFSPSELANIKNAWSRVAEKYAPFNVNVTTVDPAVAAGQAATDALRTEYYDSQAQMMHTVIGGDGAWSGGGGISFLGTTVDSWSGSNGYHTNWVFSALAPSNLQFLGEASSHENGHGLSLVHQSDYSTGPLPDVEYSLGTGTGPGSQAPIMGNSYTAERGTWKIGTAYATNLGPTLQNDPLTILGNAGMGTFIDDGIGHTLSLATPLPTLNGGLVDSSLAKGIIVPASSTDPLSSGESNYVADFWSFTTGAGLVTLTAHAGRSTITPGIADPGATLDSTFRILDANGVVLGSAATISLSETLSLSLAMGTYYAQVVSAADPGDLGFYDMGSYFLSGNLIPVPEPSTLVLLAFGLTALACGLRRRRRN